MIPSLRQHEPSQKNRFDPAQSINHLIVMRPSSTLFLTSLGPRAIIQHRGRRCGIKGAAPTEWEGFSAFRDWPV
ncbi:MAG: hypothetical protein CML59_07540 [Rhodobacteraceae bacterium]|nr:hypothetical protein [Paracoccaceae bacterium]